MRGQDHVGTRHIIPMALGSALLMNALASTATLAVSDPGSLPRCAEPGNASTDDGEIVSPWEAVLDEEGAVTGHHLTIKHDGKQHRLLTGRRSFAVRAGAKRLLIGERSRSGTRLDMVDTSRACRLWARNIGRSLYPERDEASGVLRLNAHEPDSRRYEGTHVLDPESGDTQVIVETPCLESCHPTDGDISLAALTAATAVKPTPSFAAGGWPKDKRLAFRWKAGSVPPSWARSPLQSGALDATSSSESRSPEFVYSSGGFGAVAYGRLASFCGNAAIACAGRDMPTDWGVWVRPYGTEFSWGTLRWCQKISSASGCFDIRRVMIHELGHIAGLNHPSTAGYRLAAGDSIMQAVTPMRPQAGSSRHSFGRCDAATLQELYDTPDNKTDISTCNDVATTVSLTASRWTIGKGASVILTATLRVADQSAYRQLAANPLNGRSMRLKYRRADSNDSWKTVWMKSTYKQGRYEATLRPDTTWELKAVFNKPHDEGLRYSRSAVKKVKVNS